ncbi:Uncharacterized protein FKW44_025382, partial [Caligus rogercresseyi]
RSAHEVQDLRFTPRLQSHGFDASSSSHHHQRQHPSTNSWTPHAASQHGSSHEIAVNRDFKLEDLKPESSALEKELCWDNCVRSYLVALRPSKGHSLIPAYRLRNGEAGLGAYRAAGGPMGSLMWRTMHSMSSASGTSLNIVSLLQGIMETLDLMSWTWPTLLCTRRSLHHCQIRRSKNHTEWLLRHASMVWHASLRKKLLPIGSSWLIVYAVGRNTMTYRDAVMDYKRIAALRDRVERTSGASEYIVPADAQGLKLRMKKDVDILLEDFYWTMISRDLPKLGDQVIRSLMSIYRRTRGGLPLYFQRALERPYVIIWHKWRIQITAYGTWSKGALDFAKRAAVGSKSGAPLQIPL